MDETIKDLQETADQTSKASHDSCQKELQQAKERHLYLNAEFDNYKKRIEKERSQWIDQAEDSVILDILPIVDDMERALAELKKSTLPAEAATHMAGFELIAKSLSKLLHEYKIEEIAHTTEFDPEKFEAVMQTPSSNHQSGEIIAILQKGYIRNGRVLRPAKVSVAQ